MQTRLGTAGESLGQVNPEAVLGRLTQGENRNRALSPEESPARPPTPDLHPAGTSQPGPRSPPTPSRKQQNFRGTSLKRLVTSKYREKNSGNSDIKED